MGNAGRHGQGPSTAMQPSDRYVQLHSQLVAMGFGPEAAEVALVQTQGNLQQALDLLARNRQAEDSMASRKAVTDLNTAAKNAAAQSRRELAAAASEKRSRDWRQNSAAGASSQKNKASRKPTPAPTSLSSRNDGLSEQAALERAIAISLQHSETQQTSTQAGGSIAVAQGSAVGGDTNVPMKRKEARAAAKAHRTDWQVKIDKKLNRLGKVVAAKPVALDTLIKVLSTIQDKPDEQKYRRLRWKNKKFEREIKYTPGAVDFLEAVGFVSQGKDGDLYLPSVDIGLLWSARSVLEKQKTRDVYLEAVRDIEFQMAANSLLSTSSSAVSEAERVRRKQYAANVPPEPKVGSAQQSRIVYIIGDERFERRFRSDASLGHAMNYLGSRSSVVANKIADGEWFLVNATTFPSTPLDISGAGREKTLYSLGLWPSADLRVSRKPVAMP